MSPLTRRKSAIALAGLAVGAMLGVWAGDALGHYSARRNAEADLSRYAERLLVTGADVVHETDAAVKDVLTDKLPFCSNEELAYMRNWVYNAQYVRDLGRMKDDKLVCASGIGRLDPPKPALKPDVQVEGMRIYASVPLMISRTSRGFVVQSKDVSVVLNPAQFDNLDEPPMLFGGWVHLKQWNVLVHGFGHKMPLTDAEILREQPLVKNGVEYHPLCAKKASVCVVGAEPLTAMVSPIAGMRYYFALMGGILGGLMAAVALLFLRVHRSLENQLRRAIRRGALRVEYQPVVSLSSGRIVAAEVLARWNDEAGMPIPPALFIPMAEEKGFLGEVTRLVAMCALREMGNSLASGEFRITLNIGVQDLEDPGFGEFLRERLWHERVPASALGLELTERSTANHPMAKAAIDRLKAAGHSVYLDDFGTGYSSLSYLHELQVDAIKIDKTFTQTVGTDAVTASVVPQILVMARELDLLVVVEGIETQEQAEYFAASGVRILGQGWFFGGSVPAAELKALLRANAGEG